MNIVIDTPYTTVTELARRTGQSESLIRKEIKNGRLLIREKTEGSKEAVLVNMVHIAMEAAEQAERVRAETSKSSSQR
ncbi:hypothetical protein L3X14_06060 [Pseudomonas balearica]|uniref:hypothetical protein n=1 Tax=Stutzerimonas balearica TaxID=74829 RepID=UPI001F1B83E7|nr:hypothetical protein [Stutzerimonas balearica]MCF6756155.1 hypothetical protein [Stutzerimonas balearica]